MSKRPDLTFKIIAIGNNSVAIWEYWQVTGDGLGKRFTILK